MHWFELFLFTLAICFLVSGFDDLIIDLVHLLYRVRPEKKTAAEWTAIDALPQQQIAVMVPAWSEYEVIGQMIRANTQRVDYANYQWFIGIYPNDADTARVGRRLAKEFPDRVNLVMVDRPGPTSKAHCLNNILKALVEKANTTSWEPDFVVLHDAEDLVHPDSFKAVNALDSKTEFCQVPIFALHTSLFSLTSGTYMDEFAENHLKEIPTRQLLGMPIPSAGVGTFIRFQTLLRAQEYFGYAFNEDSLTEDYDLSMRLAYIGTSQKFLTMESRTGKALIATQEYFPHRVRTSIRQKTRWIIGITLQGVALIKPKTVAKIYGRIRDRKGLVTNAINLMGWIGFVTALTLLASKQLPPFVHGDTLTRLFYANSAILIIRLVQRFRFTYRTYGLGHACVGVFRVLLVNYINMVATFRAIYQYNRANPNDPKRKQAIKWDKTDHHFPSEDKLGEISQ
ncbi:MAG: glycosyltransferase [Bdellovibrionales bacterium]|nr:glycosyltransferase [Bdellovibrionales bacterium]